MGQTEPMNQEMEFDIGEEEKETTVEMNEDGSEAKLADEKETPKYVYLTSVVLGGSNMFSVLGNTTGLVTHEPSRAFAYLGVVGGALSIGFAFVLAQEEPKHESMSIFFGVTGGLALGLGAFNFRLAHQLNETGSAEFRLEPVFILDGSGYVGGIGVSVDF